MKKDIVMKIRTTAKLKEKIKKNAEKNNMNMSQYIRGVLEKRNIIVIKEGSDILFILKRAGNNLNELAKKVNSGIATRKDMDKLADISKDMDEVCQILYDLNQRKYNNK